MEANLNMEGALKDLERAQKAMKGNATYGAQDRERIEITRARIAQQVFEMNRESDPPRLTVLEPYSKDSVAKVSASLSHLKVSGHILDKSSIEVHHRERERRQNIDKEEKDPQFFTSIPWGPNDKEIIVQATDIYENTTSAVLRVERTEGISPLVALPHLSFPQATAVEVAAGKESVFVEGKVTDASLIRLIAVNGVNASYAPDQFEPGVQHQGGSLTTTTTSRARGGSIRERSDERYTPWCGKSHRWSWPRHADPVPDKVDGVRQHQRRLMRAAKPLGWCTSRTATTGTSRPFKAIAVMRARCRRPSPTIPLQAPSARRT